MRAAAAGGAPSEGRQLAWQKGCKKRRGAGNRFGGRDAGVRVQAAAVVVTVVVVAAVVPVEVVEAVAVVVVKAAVVEVSRAQ